MPTITFSPSPSFTANSDRETESDFGVSNAHLLMHQSGIHSTQRSYVPRRYATEHAQEQWTAAPRPEIPVWGLVLDIRTTFDAIQLECAIEEVVAGGPDKVFMIVSELIKNVSTQGLFLFKYLMFLSSFSLSSPHMKFMCVRLSRLCIGYMTIAYKPASVRVLSYLERVCWRKPLVCWWLCIEVRF